MIKSIDETQLAVQLDDKYRIIEDDESDLTFQRGHIVYLKPRDIRSRTLKKLLIDGILKVVQGEIEFEYKGENFKFVAK